MILPLVLITFTNIFVAGMICREIMSDRAHGNKIEPFTYLWFILNFFCGIVLMVSVVGKAMTL